MTRAGTVQEAEPADGGGWCHRDGDAQAFAELVARYRRPVYGYLVRCGVEPAARDDLFQEVFAAIHRGAATYHAERRVKPWVFAIAANVVRSHYRKARGRALLPQPAVVKIRRRCHDGHHRYSCCRRSQPLAGVRVGT
jgi:DNA-directed RNA polymerase specialized sigma24 family protein